MWPSRRKATSAPNSSTRFIPSNCPRPFTHRCVMRLTISHSLLLVAFLSLCTFIAGCDSDGVSAKSLSPFIGQKNADLLDAGGKLVSAASLSEKDEDAIGQ